MLLSSNDVGLSGYKKSRKVTDKMKNKYFKSIEVSYLDASISRSLMNPESGSTTDIFKSLKGASILIK